MLFSLIAFRIRQWWLGLPLLEAHASQAFKHPPQLLALLVVVSFDCLSPLKCRGGALRCRAISLGYDSRTLGSMRLDLSCMRSRIKFPLSEHT